jgi:HD superfamily phosphohydrolase
MGCDYYILKLLHIYYSETDYVELELTRERGYYDDLQFDEDADDYDEKVSEHIREMLTPKTEPIVIYINNRFNKLSCAEKYKTIIETEINQRDKKWCEITKIIKVEERQER